MGEDEVVEEAARQASARAADALSALVGQTLTSSAHVARADDAPEKPREMVGTKFSVQGFGESDFLAAFSLPSLKTVREMLAPGMEDTPATQDFIALEMGNICASHFLNTLGDMIHTTLLPSPPALTHGEERQGKNERAFLIHADFKTPSGETIHGTLRFRPTDNLVEAIRKVEKG